jgi:cobalamin biosynthesis Co2+ chelatase CbiK
MALKKQIQIQLFGEVLNIDSYIKCIIIGATTEEIQSQVEFYRYDNKEIFIKREFINFKPDVSDSAKNFIKQIYEYLKTLDNFKDAVDLLDEGQTA